MRPLDDYLAEVKVKYEEHPITLITRHECVRHVVNKAFDNQEVSFEVCDLLEEKLWQKWKQELTSNL